MIEVARGDGPLVLGLPHTGTELPADVAARLNDRGRALADTDWHVHRLYAGLAPAATTVRTTIHRYAIDVNRAPDGVSLYPGQNTTGLVPLTDFDGEAIWQEGEEPRTQQVERLRDAYHAPYHEALAAELARVRDRHGVALLYDCHSIRSTAPFLFDGVLPDFSIGTNDGQSCAAVVEEVVRQVCDGAPGYSTVVNGRFRGGWTTRHYGRPDAGVHAIQMELAQSTYMDEAPPWTWRAERAARLRGHLGRALGALEKLALEGALG